MVTILPLKNNLVTPNLDQTRFSGCNALYLPLWSARLPLPTAWWPEPHRCALWTSSSTFAKLKTDQTCLSSFVPSVMAPTSLQSPDLSCWNQRNSSQPTPSWLPKPFKYASVLLATPTSSSPLTPPLPCSSPHINCLLGVLLDFLTSPSSHSTLC